MPTTNTAAVAFYRQLRHAIGAGAWAMHTEFHATPQHSHGNKVTTTLIIGADEVIRALRREAQLDQIPVIVDVIRPEGSVIAVTLTARHFAPGATPTPYTADTPAARLIEASVTLYNVPGFCDMDAIPHEGYAIQPATSYSADDAVSDADDIIITPTVLVAELESLAREFLTTAPNRDTPRDRRVLATDPNYYPIYT